MAFSSKLYPGELIINDSTPEIVPPKEQGTGLRLPRGHSPEGDNYVGAADPFPPELLIPESEWQARIQEMEETKTRLSDIINAAGLPCKDQARTSQCWVNAPCHCVEIMRLLQNQEMVILSPSSVGGPVKNFRDPGGWGLEALQYAQDHGFCPVDKWPANAISKQYWTEENKKIALLYRQTEWWELKPRNKQQQMSLLLRRIPGAYGQNHWQHEVTGVDPVWLDGTAAARIRNSWTMDWPTPGAGGYAIQQGSKMLCDDLVAPRVATAS